MDFMQYLPSFNIEIVIKCMEIDLNVIIQSLKLDTLIKYENIYKEMKLFMNLALFLP